MRISYKGMTKDFEYRLAEIWFNDEKEFHKMELIKKIIENDSEYKLDIVTDSYAQAEVSDAEDYKEFVRYYKKAKKEVSALLKQEKEEKEIIPIDTLLDKFEKRHEPQEIETAETTNDSQETTQETTQDTGIISNELVNAIANFYSNFTPVLTGYRTKVHEIESITNLYFTNITPVIIVRYDGNTEVEWSIKDEEIPDYENSLQDIYRYNTEIKQFELEKK